MNLSTALKSAAGVVLSLALSTLASAAQNPCATSANAPQCVAAIAALHQRTTEHSAGTVHAKSAIRATRPLVETTPPDAVVPEMDRIHSGEAHPVAARHERQAH